MDSLRPPELAGYRTRVGAQLGDGANGCGEAADNGGEHVAFLVAGQTGEGEAEFALGGFDDELAVAHFYRGNVGERDLLLTELGGVVQGVGVHEEVKADLGIPEEQKDGEKAHNRIGLEIGWVGVEQMRVRMKQPTEERQEQQPEGIVAAARPFLHIHRWRVGAAGGGVKA